MPERKPAKRKRAGLKDFRSALEKDYFTGSI
jgi:hypothetical protein